MSKLVLFDYGGVVGEDGALHMFYRNKLTNSKNLEEYKRKSAPPNKRLDLGEITEETFWELCIRSCPSILDELGFSQQCKKEEEGYIEKGVKFMMTELRKMFHLFSDVINFANELKKKNDIEIGILSNNGKEWFRDFFYKEKLDRIWDKKEFVLVSCDLKCVKPEDKIYEIVNSICTTHGFNLEKDVFFIDNTEENIVSAKKNGIKNSILFDAKVDSIEKLKNEMKKRGIDC